MFIQMLFGVQAWKYAREYLYPIDINKPSPKVYGATSPINPRRQRLMT